MAQSMKYLKIAEQLRRQVRAGVLKPGERLPSLGEMRQQGVSQNTMERVHLLLEQEGLIVRHHRRGVFVAQPPAERATGIIGVLGDAFVHNPDVPYWAHLLAGIRAAAHERGRELLLLGDSVPGLGWEKIDGVLSCNLSEVQEQQRHLPPGMPNVSMVGLSRIAPSVIANDYAGAKAATEHLLELGHRRIAYLLNNRGSNVKRQPPRRLEGYRAALWEAGIEPNPHWTRELMSPAEWKPDSTIPFDELGYDKMSRWLREDWQALGCTALITQNDESAIGAITALREAGIGVPDEVSVVGFDGTKVGEYCTPRLTSVRVPLREMGRKGVELLLRQIGEEVVEVEATMLPTRLVTRESSGPAPGQALIH